MFTPQQENRNINSQQFRPELIFKVKNIIMNPKNKSSYDIDEILYKCKKDVNDIVVPNIKTIVNM